MKKENGTYESQEEQNELDCFLLIDNMFYIHFCRETTETLLLSELTGISLLRLKFPYAYGNFNLGLPRTILDNKRVILTMSGRFQVMRPASVVWKPALSRVFSSRVNTLCFHRGNVSLSGISAK